jgi:hypothetical protein
MNRLWKVSLLLGLTFAFVWWRPSTEWILVSQRSGDIWIFVGAVVSVSFAIFALTTKNMCYVQAFPTHMRLVTPFLRLKISYRRLRKIHPIEFHKTYPPNELKWADRKFLTPFFGKTAIALELNDYPLSPVLLRLFLPARIFHPSMIGFVFVVENWIALSTELDSLHGNWREKRRHKNANPKQQILHSLRQT